MPAEPACPICGRPSRPATKPFCSPRCRSVDLGRWLGETYAIPGPIPDAENPLPGAGKDDEAE